MQWHELIKVALRARYSFCVWVFCAVVLLAPLPEFLEVPDEFNVRAKPWVGVLGLLAFIVWIVEIALSLSSVVRERLAERKVRLALIEQLENLSNDELNVLGRALVLNSRTIRWRDDYDEVSSLVARGLLLPVPGESPTHVRPYIIPVEIWKHLAANRQAFLDRAIAQIPGFKAQVIPADR